MAITETGLRYGSIRINFNDGTVSGYKEVAKVTYLRDYVLVNFVNGSRSTFMRSAVKNVVTEADVYVAFGDNGKSIGSKQPVKSLPAPAKRVGRMVDGVVVPFVTNDSARFC